MNDNNHYLPSLTDSSLSLEFKRLRRRLYNILTAAVNDVGTAIDELSGYVFICVDRVRGLNSYIVSPPSSSWVDGHNGIHVAIRSVIPSRASDSLRGHINMLLSNRRRCAWILYASYVSCKVGSRTCKAQKISRMQGLNLENV